MIGEQVFTLTARRICAAGQLCRHRSGLGNHPVDLRHLPIEQPFQVRDEILGLKRCLLGLSPLGGQEIVAECRRRPRGQKYQQSGKQQRIDSTAGEGLMVDASCHNLLVERAEPVAG